MKNNFIDQNVPINIRTSFNKFGSGTILYICRISNMPYVHFTMNNCRRIFPKFMSFSTLDNSQFLKWMTNKQRYFRLMVKCSVILTLARTFFTIGSKANKRTSPEIVIMTLVMKHNEHLQLFFIGLKGAISNDVYGRWSFCTKRMKDKIYIVLWILIKRKTNFSFFVDLSTLSNQYEVPDALTS